MVGIEEDLKIHLDFFFFDLTSDFFFFFFFFWAAPTAYGGCPDKGWISAVAASIHHSHSNTGSEPHLQSTPQLTAMPDP